MDIVSILSFLQNIPTVGPWIVIALQYVIPIVLALSSLFAVMHALIISLKAVSIIKGCGGLSAIADSLKVDDDAAEGFFNSKVKPIVDRLSLIPLPKK